MCCPVVPLLRDHSCKIHKCTNLTVLSFLFSYRSTHLYTHVKCITCMGTRLHFSNSFRPQLWMVTIKIQSNLFPWGISIIPTFWKNKIFYIKRYRQVFETPKSSLRSEDVSSYKNLHRVFSFFGGGGTHTPSNTYHWICLLKTWTWHKCNIYCSVL